MVAEKAEKDLAAVKRLIGHREVEFVAPIKDGYCIQSYPCQGHGGVCIVFTDGGQTEYGCDSLSIAYLQRELNPDHDVDDHFQCYLRHFPPRGVTPPEPEPATAPDPRTESSSSTSQVPAAPEEIVCSLCGKVFQEHAVSIVIGGKFRCCSCVKCTVCLAPMTPGSIALVGNDIVHKKCIVHEPCRNSLFPNNFYKTAEGTLACSYCTGCQCGAPECQYTTTSPSGERRRFLLKRKSEVHRLLLLGGKPVLPAHRPCGVEGCEEWCDTNHDLCNPSPVCARVCNTCGKCEHVNGGVFEEYSIQWDAGIKQIEPYLIGHKECVKCAECRKSAKCTPPTYNHWVVKDGRVTHAMCFKCEDPNCGEKKKARIVVAQYGDETKYVHIMCYRAWKKKYGDCGTESKKQKMTMK